MSYCPGFGDQWCDLGKPSGCTQHIFLFPLYPEIMVGLLAHIFRCEANHVPPLSLVWLFGGLFRMSPPVLPKMLSVCFPFFWLSTTNFLISSSLEANFDCISQVSPCIWPHATSPLVSFLLSFWAWNGTGRTGLLGFSLTVGPGINHVFFFLGGEWGGLSFLPSSLRRLV